MKMSDVFMLPAALNEKHKKKCLVLDGKAAEYAVRAINNHDRLVAKNEALKTALTNLLSELSTKHGIGLDRIVGVGMRECLINANNALEPVNN